MWPTSGSRMDRVQGQPLSNSLDYPDRGAHRGSIAPPNLSVLLPKWYKPAPSPRAGKMDVRPASARAAIGGHVTTCLTEPACEPSTPQQRRREPSAPIRGPPLLQSPRRQRSHRRPPQLPTAVSTKLLDFEIPESEPRKPADWQRRQHAATLRLQSAQRGRMARRALKLSRPVQTTAIPEWRSRSPDPVAAVPPVPSVPLREAAPAWMRPLPARIVKAAERFDAQHARRTRVTGRLHIALCRDVTSGGKTRCFASELMELRRTRYWAPPPPPRPKAKDSYARSARRGGPAVAVRPPPNPAWTIEGSIWWTRAQWCDSKSLYDTEECERKKLAAVVRRARDRHAAVHHPERRRRRRRRRGGR